MIDLDALMTRVLTALRLTSEVASALAFMRDTSEPRVKGITSHGKPPPGPATTPAEYYARRYRGCRTDEQRRQVIRDALDELRHIRYGRHPKSDRLKEARLQIGRDPRPANLVAYIYGYSVRHIYRLRAEARKAGTPSERALP